MIISDAETATALIFAPHGRDAAVAKALLGEAGIRSAVCANLLEFENRLDEDASFAVVTDEAVRFHDLRGIAARLAAQPAWSDLPFIVLTRRAPGSENSPQARALYETAGNVTLVERPFHPATFISVARSAMKGRQRQYEARARLEELHEGEERLRTALLAGRLGSFELDLTTLALTVSEAGKAHLGRAADEDLSYEDLIQSIHPDDREHVRNSVRDAAGMGADCDFECRTVWPDGAIHWLDLRARLFRCPAGRPRLVGVSSDITDPKTRQETLMRLNEALEEGVAARTAELRAAHATVLREIEHRERAEEQLRQAQKLEMIGKLTGGIAHDFNNLLMAVLGSLELLQKHVAADPRAARLVGRALQGAERGAALTRRLLAFARRQELKVEAKNLADLIREAAGLIDRSVGPQIELIFNLPEGLPLVLLDASQIELALLNLVVNARDAMPDGGVLSIAVDHLDTPGGAGLPPGHYVRMSVSDTGSGMDATTLERAIEPFFSTKEPGKGTGLGLSMAHGLAAQLNGALRLASEAGVGTTAELWLPVTTVAAEDEKRRPPAQEREAAEKITVLVVDDDELVATSTVEMLKDLGHEVIEANSGDRALDILREPRPIDLLVTDYAMPRMNGAQLAAAARQIRPGLKIILATGYAELPAGGPVPHRIAKPYRQDEMAEAVRKVLSGASGERPC